MDKASLIPVGDMPQDAELMKVSLTAKGQTGLAIKVLVGNQVWLINESEQDLSLPEGSLMVGFSPGKFKIDAPMDEAHIYQYELCSANTEVVFSNKLTTVMEVVKEPLFEQIEI